MFTIIYIFSIDNDYYSRSILPRLFPLIATVFGQVHNIQNEDNEKLEAYLDR